MAKVVKASCVHSQVLSSIVAKGLSVTGRMPSLIRLDIPCILRCNQGLGTSLHSGMMSPGRARTWSSQTTFEASQAPVRRNARSEDSEGRVDQDTVSGRPSALRATEATSQEDLEALVGSIFDEFHVDPRELDGSMDCSLDGSTDQMDCTLPPDNRWKVSKDCKVLDVMIPNPRACKPDDIIKDIVGMFAERSGVPVVSDDNVVIGMITRKDVMRIKKKHGSLKHRVEDFMSAPAITVTSTSTAEDVAQTLLEKSVHRVPVVDSMGHLVGVASKSNLFTKMAGPENETETMDKLAGDEDLMGSEYWRNLEFQDTVDYDDLEENQETLK